MLKPGHTGQAWCVNPYCFLLEGISRHKVPCLTDFLQAAVPCKMAVNLVQHGNLSRKQMLAQKAGASSAPSVAVIDCPQPPYLEHKLGVILLLGPTCIDQSRRMADGRAWLISPLSEASALWLPVRQAPAARTTTCCPICNNLALERVSSYGLGFRVT
jgi:hypothetical protein